MNLINAQRLARLIFVGLIGLSLLYVAIFSENIINLGGLNQLRQFFFASLRPDLTPTFLQLTFNAALITLAYAVCGTTLSLILGFMGGILSSQVFWRIISPQNSYYLLIRLSLRFLLALPRSIHEMIWGLIFINIWGLDPLSGILAITIPYAAIVSKVFSEILDETPRQPLMTLQNSGVPPLSALLYGLFPSALLNLISYSFYRFECAIRSATVLGMIGAGGLGYEIFLSLQSLRYEQLWTLFYGLIGLNTVIDGISAKLRQRLGCTSRLDLNLGKSTRVRTQDIKTDYRTTGATVALISLIPFCFIYIQPNFSLLWSEKTQLFFDHFVSQILVVDFSFISLKTGIILSFQTLAISLLGILFAGLGGLLFSFFAASNLFLSGGLFNPHRTGKRAWLSLIVIRFILLLSRAIPAPIWALVALFVFFPGIVPGAIALGIHNLGIIGRLMAEVIENIKKSPLEALKAQGSPPISLFLYGVLPATLPQFLAYSFYRWEVCLRETLIVGLVGAGGLGRLLTEQLSSFDYGGIMITLGLFMGLTVFVDSLSGMMRGKY